MTDTPIRVAVIGGGISGLAAAHRLRELAPEIALTLFEAADRLGGVLQTQRRDGCLIERSADMFTTRDPWALDLCRRLGFENQLVNTNSAHRQAFVVFRGRLQPVPEGFTLMSPARVWPVLKTPLLSWLGKLRLACEYFVPRRDDKTDESLADFSCRRFGRETYERLIQPLIGGIYTADPKKLSMRATMRQFVELEREHGSLIRGMRRAARKQAAQGAGGEQKASGARYGLFVTPKDGMSSLVAAITERLPPESIRLRTPIVSVRKDGDRRWTVISETAPGERREETFDAVIIAAPGHRTTRIVESVDADLARMIGQIPHAGAAVVVAAYHRADVRRQLDGFGFVAPLREKRRILSGSLSSVKFPGRAPDDLVLTRAFLGGACQPELLNYTDPELIEAAYEELADLLDIQGRPVFSEVVRWHGTMPQYHVGHVELVDEIEKRAAAIAGLALAGNAYRGVGLPFCIRSGEAAAQRIIDQVRSA